MDGFYTKAETQRVKVLAQRQKDIAKQWKTCVLAASKNAVTLDQVECHVEYKPDHDTLRNLETETIKLDTYDSNYYKRLYENQHQNYVPESWFIKVRTPPNQKI